MLTQYEKAAFHEAGHAVVASLSTKARNVAAVRIQPGGLGGMTYGHEKPVASTGELHERIIESMRVLYAGPIAEALATGDSQGYELDTARIGALLALDTEIAKSAPEKLTPARAEAASKARGATAAASAEFYVRSMWGAVEKVAAALVRCGTLTGAQLETLIDCAPKTARLPDSEAELASLLRRASGDRVIADSFAAACRRVAA